MSLSLESCMAKLERGEEHAQSLRGQTTVWFTRRP
jgi:hypothetical protein